MWEAIRCSYRHGCHLQLLLPCRQCFRNKESLVRVAVWCIGEYGDMLVNNTGVLEVEEPKTMPLRSLLYCHGRRRLQSPEPKKKRKKKRGKKSVPSIDSIEESSIIGGVNREAIESISNNYSYTVLQTPSTIVVPEVLDRDGGDYSVRSVTRAPHLRQRSVTFTVTKSESTTGNAGLNNSSCDGGVVEKDNEMESKPQRTFEMNGRQLEKDVSLDWKKIMAEDPNYAYHVEKSPIKYFLEEMHAGNSLRRTANLGNEREREKVYNTLFQLPWRIELPAGEALCRRRSCSIGKLHASLRLVQGNYKNQLLHLAEDLGRHFLRDFHTSTGLPYGWINLKIRS